MKKVIYLMAILGLVGFARTANAQIADEQNITMTMDLQPILQLEMETPDHVEFIFDEIRDYYTGITKYGATKLKVSSTVTWELWAVGHNTAANTAYWDQMQDYGDGITTAASDNLPLSCLEIHQYPKNSRSAGCTQQYPDYQSTFKSTATATPSDGSNNVYYTSAGANNLYYKPGVTDKYIYGHMGAGTQGAGVGGSYLLQPSMPGTASATTFYYFVMDYRIVPGLPVQFPYAARGAAGGNVSEALINESYAQPGVYTMNVKYVLMEGN